MVIHYIKTIGKKTFTIRRNFILFRIMPLAFIFFLIFPFINQYISLIDKKESTENRALFPEPNLEMASIDSFPQKYEQYYNDHFNLRNNYNRYLNYLKYKHFDLNPAPGTVVVGKDGWLFYNNDNLPARKANHLFNEAQLDSIKNELEERAEYLKTHNCSLYVGLIPSKASLYYNKLEEPHFYEKNIEEPSRTSQLCDYIQKNSSINMVNLTDALLKHKDTHQLFRQYDHHWNAMGGYYASQAMLEIIQKDFKQVRTLDSSGLFKMSSEKFEGGDLAMVFGFEEFFSETTPRFKYDDWQNQPKSADRTLEVPEGFAYGWGYENRKTTKNDSLPNAMIIRDSFGCYLINYMSYGFNNSLYLWDEWKYYINKEIFLKEKPEVFVILIADHNLQQLMDKSK